MLTYLAAPYSHPDVNVRAQRMFAFYKADASLTMAGANIVSPLYKSTTAQYADIPDTWEYWRSYSYHLLMASYRIIVLMLPGWEESPGVAAEIAFALKNNKRVEYLEPEADWLKGPKPLGSITFNGFESTYDMGEQLMYRLEAFQQSGKLDSEFDGNLVFDISYFSEPDDE